MIIIKIYIYSHLTKYLEFSINFTKLFNVDQNRNSLEINLEKEYN